MRVRFLSSAPEVVIILSSTTSFHSVFIKGLISILELPDPTPEQLVAVTTSAIALGNHTLLDRARKLITPRLQSTAINTSSEDFQVLRHIFAASDPFALVHHRTTPAGFGLQYNELRSFRPRRESTTATPTVHRPFEPAKFNFTHISGERYWQGSFGNKLLACYYNKYPFAPYHTSLVPDPDSDHEQFLTQPYHELAWNFLQALAGEQPKAVLGYNSLGSYASINHLHFQLVADGHKLPLLHSKNLTTYPIPVTEHQNIQTAWRQIAHLQATQQPFNLIYSAGRMIVIERQFQGTYPQPNWTTGFAWYELCGGIITVSEDAFDRITDDDITTALQTTVSVAKALSS